MKKLMLSLAVIGAAVIALAVGGIAYAKSAAPAAAPFQMAGPLGPRGPHGNEVGPANSPLHAYMLDAFAGALDLTAEELTARLEAGDTIRDIAAEKNLTLSEFDTLMETARTEALAAAVADGAITQAQADQMAQGPAFGPGGPHHGQPGPKDGPLHDYLHTALATALELTPEELAAKIEGGSTLQDLFAEKGLTTEEIQTLMATTRTEALAAAVADGVITQAQADQMAQAPAFGPGGGPGGNHGPCENGPQGPGGHRGPGFGPGTQQPATQP